MTTTSQSQYAMMQYQARQRSVGVAFLLWLFVGGFGAHRFYLGRKGTALAQLLCTVLVVGIPVTAVWVLVDAFLIPGIVRNTNLSIAEELHQDQS